jgi:hypothetical protein
MMMMMLVGQKRDCLERITGREGKVTEGGRGWRYAIKTT